MQDRIAWVMSKCTDMIEDLDFDCNNMAKEWI